jgi:hypothetical protein
LPGARIRLGEPEPPTPREDVSPDREALEFPRADRDPAPLREEPESPREPPEPPREEPELLREPPEPLPEPPEPLRDEPELLREPPEPLREPPEPLREPPEPLRDEPELLREPPEPPREEPEPDALPEELERDELEADALRDEPPRGREEPAVDPLESCDPRVRLEDRAGVAPARERDRVVLARCSRGISAFTSSLTRRVCSLSRNLAMRSSSRRMVLASFAVSRSPTSLANASIRL